VEIKTHDINMTKSYKILTGVKKLHRE